MHTFTVWAPRARTMAVVVGDRSYTMQPAERGWWSAAVEDAGPASEYSFILDNGNPLPDPRSGSQPHGPHGASQLIDHGAFQWTDQHWQAKPLSGAIVYELHIGTFTPGGTFASTLEKLDYLIDLGITHVEIMPVNEFSGKWGWGYDGVDLFAPHHRYGTPDDLKRLVDTCHAKGLAVILDAVYNHFGPAGNYVDQFGPYFIDTYQTPWGQAVNLDGPGSNEARKFFADNARMWLRDYHFDGLRLDAVHAYFDRSAMPFLEYLASEVESLSGEVGRHLILIAESDLNDPRIVTSRQAGGLGIDAQWSDDFHHALHSVLTTERSGYYEDFGSYADLRDALQRAFVYIGQYSPNRDRLHGRPPLGLSGSHFLGYAQNHDQVGNRAQGERFSHLLSVGRQKIAMALVMTSPFVPMLFQGEEFGASSPFLYFTQHEDEELGRLVSKGRRSEFSAFGWDPEQVPDPQEKDSFERSKLKWNEVTQQPHAALLEWTRDLIELRRHSRNLTDGRLDLVEVKFDERAQWFVLKRGLIEVVINLAPDRQAVPISRTPREVLCSEPGWSLRPASIELGPDSVAVFTA